MEPVFPPDFARPADPLRTSPDNRFIRSDDKLGQGQFKVVYRGVDTLNGTEVAFNLINLERLDCLQTRNFFDEVQLLRRIDSPYIISFYDVWLAPFGADICGASHLVFVTELMGSGTIARYMQLCHRINLATIKRWCTQILRGLEYLHTLDPPVLHRDIKPDNIFLNTNLAHSAQGEVKIGDLGLSRAVSPDTVAHTVAGTPEFMAPECFDGCYDVRADIYAFGLTLLEMCTFTYPYKECRGAIGVYRRVSEGIPPESLKLVTHAPTHDIIERCIGPVDTRPSATQLLDDPWLQLDPLDVTVFFTPEGQLDVPMLTPSGSARALSGLRPLSTDGPRDTYCCVPSRVPRLSEPAAGCSYMSPLALSQMSRAADLGPSAPATMDSPRNMTVLQTAIPPDQTSSVHAASNPPEQAQIPLSPTLSMAPPPIVEPPIMRNSPAQGSAEGERPNHSSS